MAKPGCATASVVASIRQIVYTGSVQQGGRPASAAAVVCPCPPLLRALIHACALACVLCGTSWAQALQAESWLDWSGPKDCEHTAEVERQVEALLDRSVDFAALAPTSVEVRWRQETDWELSLRVAFPSGTRERRVTAKTCSAGLDVVALALALLIDEGMAAEAPLAPRASPLRSDDGLADADDWDVGSERSAGAALGSRFASTSPSPAELAAPGDPAAEDSKPASEGEQPASSSSTQRTWPWTLGGAFRTDFGTLPEELYGAGMTLGLRTQGFRSELAGEWFRSAADVVPGALWDVDYTLLSASATACSVFPVTGELSYSNCAGVRLGSLTVSELGESGRRTRALLGSVQVGAELGYWAQPSWYNFAHLQLSFPLQRHSLFLDNGTPVHQLPAVSLLVAVGFSIDVTDLAGTEH